MRISDWSSDVCSSDLRVANALLARSGRAARGGGRAWPPDRLRCPAAGRGRMTKAHNVDAQRLSFILNELRLPAIKVIWPEFTERADRSEEHTSELQSLMRQLVCRLLLEKKKEKN